MRVLGRSLLSSVVVCGSVALAGFLPSVSAQAAPTADYLVRPGANQIEVIGASPGDALSIAGPATHTGTADALGSFEWRLLPAGHYTVTDGTRTDSVTVTDFSTPAPGHAFYANQTLHEGFNYITTRDGTTLSANVVFPTNAPLPAGAAPWPTVVEYSGYDPSNPGNTTMAQLFNALGYAYVGVNIRGTGCSGGSFLNFEPVQSLDGYDAIETVAAQSWVKGNTVGMVGISYPGISQLYVAQTRPPHLSAIAPLSVMDDTYRGTLYPGGMLNTGFAVPWAQERASQSAPYGEAWTKNHDATCDANQKLRLQNPDPLAMVHQFPFRSSYPYDSISPAAFVGKINVPVYIAGVWQDEQTGGHFPDMLGAFRTKQLYATMTNGSHVDSLANQNICNRMTDFLDLYVAKVAPQNRAVFVCPVIAQSATGINGITFPQAENQFNMQFYGKSYADALRIFQAQPRYRVLFESGAADGEPAGAPVARYEKSFTSWPPASSARTWFLSPKGGLRSSYVRTHRSPRTFSADPKALPTTDYTGSSGGVWAASPRYDWRQIPHGKGLGWITPALRKTKVMAGTGSVNLWVRTPAKDVDLEVTLSEVRPNGREVYVQAGWLRASHRKLSTASTELMPVHTDLASDARPMPSRVWQQVRIELWPFAHTFRRGSRIRLTLDAPGNDRPLWAFDTLDRGQKVAVATSPKRRSAIVLPLVSGVTVPKGSPACGTLRSQPCRIYP